MASCSICGTYCGFQTAHLACENKVKDGMSLEDVRREMVRSSVEEKSGRLYRTTDALPKVAGWLFPVLIVVCGFIGVLLNGAKDEGFTVVLALSGAAVGTFFAALIFTWCKMQALLARRIAEYLDGI
jgi:hypothetical protein